MRVHLIVGVLLIVIGAFLLAYQGIEYSEKEKVADLGPLEVTTTETERFDVPPIVGGAVLAGGVLVLVLGGRRRAAY